MSNRPMKNARLISIPATVLLLLASGAWQGTGVLGPEAFPAPPFLDALAEHGSPHGMLELDP